MGDVPGDDGIWSDDSGAALAVSIVDRSALGGSELTVGGGRASVDGGGEELAGAWVPVGADDSTGGGSSVAALMAVESMSGTGRESTRAAVL